jgi:hypothetical protein
MEPPRRSGYTVTTRTSTASFARLKLSEKKVPVQWDDERTMRGASAVCRRYPVKRERWRDEEMWVLPNT